MADGDAEIQSKGAGNEPASKEDVLSDLGPLAEEITKKCVELMESCIGWHQTSRASFPYGALLIDNDIVNGEIEEGRIEGGSDEDVLRWRNAERDAANSIRQIAMELRDCDERCRRLVSSDVQDLLVRLNARDRRQPVKIGGDYALNSLDAILQLSAQLISLMRNWRLDEISKPESPRSPAMLSSRSDGFLSDVREQLEVNPEALRRLSAEVRLELVAAAVSSPIEQRSAKSQTDHSAADADRVRCKEEPSVQLFGQTDSPLVFGQKVPALGRKQFNVIKVLLAEFPLGLTEVQLRNRSKQGGALKTLLLIRKSNQAWANAILLPVSSHKGGYMIAPMPSQDSRQ